MTAADFISMKIELAGHTVDSFAVSIGLSPEEMRQILTPIGKVRIDKVDAICQGLHITTEELCWFMRHS